MTAKRLIYLYSDSTFTPWKENIFGRTIASFLQSTPENYYPYVTHFVGFTEEFANFLRQFDIVFNVCYGFGEYGQHEISQWLESKEIQHTASLYESQKMAKDKVELPALCKRIGAYTPAIIPLGELANHEAQRFIAKPRFGSLHQNMHVFEKENIPYELLMEQEDLVIQPYLTGREFTVGIIPDEEAQEYICLTPLEIKPDDDREVYIAGQKYGTTEKVLNPELDEQLCEEMKQTVLKLHKVLNLRGMSRTDIRLSDGKIYILDINTMPNLDANSFLPYIAKNEGISLQELFRRLLLRFENVYFKTDNLVLAGVEN